MNMLGRKTMTLVVGLFLFAYFLAGCGIPKEDYDRVNNNLQAALADLGRTNTELSRTKTELSQTKNNLTPTNNRILQLENEIVFLKSQHDLLQASYADIKLRYADSEKRLSSTQAELEESLVVPYTAISGREITWAWKNLSGNTYKWTVSVDTYRAWLKQPKPTEKVLLRSGDKVSSMIDFRPYVRTEVFDNVISDLYRNCADEMIFAKEVFNLVTQLAVYSQDIGGEIPRWPVETLTEAGGDCEDLAILFCALLKCAPYPYKLSLVYMDADNPKSPKTPNHVVVWVEAQGWKYFAECTSKKGWGYYDEVVGWFYQL